jgi:4-hydroxy-3-polyprenylbenzoate decarboxylase
VVAKILMHLKAFPGVGDVVKPWQGVSQPVQTKASTKAAKKAKSKNK